MIHSKEIFTCQQSVFNKFQAFVCNTIPTQSHTNLPCRLPSMNPIPHCYRSHPKLHLQNSARCRWQPHHDSPSPVTQPGSRLDPHWAVAQAVGWPTRAELGQYTCKRAYRPTKWPKERLTSRWGSNVGHQCQTPATTG